MFKFTPKTDEEINDVILLAKGDGNFEVIRAEFKTSKSGNPMISLFLKVWDCNGKEGFVNDYLINTPRFEFKIKHFCIAASLENEYNNGTFNETMCTGRTGRLRLGIDKDKGGQYSDKNNVIDYLKSNGTITPKPDVIDTFFNDDIPFG